MNTTVSPIKYGYSDNGNRYVKSTQYKKIGAGIGLGMTAGCITANGRKELWEKMSKGILLAPDLREKLVRIAVVPAFLVGPAVIGGLIGFATDSILNKVRAHNTDKKADKEVAIIKKYEDAKAQETQEN